MDGQLDTLYKTEHNLSQVLAILTALTILVAAFGLFGLTLLMVQRRTREIGIRKVIWASLVDVLLVLNRHYFRWMGAAFLVACPLAWWAMSRWLEKLCLPDEPSLVAVSDYRSSRIGDCPPDGQLPEPQSSAAKPGQIPPKRIELHPRSGCWGPSHGQPALIKTKSQHSTGKLRLP